MNDAQIEQLKNEQIKGGQAQHAYDTFVRDFCEEKRLVLFQSFGELPLTAKKKMMEIKRMLYAIDTLEAEIRTVIETGQLASKTLNEVHKEVRH